MSALRDTSSTSDAQRSDLGPRASVDLASPLLTPKEAAELLGVRTSWVYEAVRQGQLPCLRLGRHIRFSRPSLERWLGEQL
ncbi:MAG: helix-turn-helix protein [Solirubrobacterales bacterium]|nr:helix-turn-helix protein [Solirubrobacterales bacterium]